MRKTLWTITVTAVLALAMLPASLPAGAASQPWVARPTAVPAAGSFYNLGNVSCTASDACTAVGAWRAPQSSYSNTLAERWDGASWTVQPTPNPAGAAGGALFAVSCTSATACVAVGSENNSDGTTQPFALSWDGATWTLQLLPAPVGAGNIQLNAVSCVTATWCKAAGYWFPPQFGDIHPMLLTWDGATWSLDTVPTPGNTKTAGFNDVDCFAQNACAAVGFFSNATKKSPALGETWNGSTWHVDSTSDPGAVSILYGVDCPSTTLCIGAGDYSGIFGGLNAQIQRRSGSIWANAAAPNPNAKYRHLFDISCPTKSNCTALGVKYNVTTAQTGYTGAYGGLGWSIQAEPAGYVLSALSCPTTSFCMAVGSDAQFNPVSATRG